MQIIRLEFEGIGPFVRRQSIDFGELSSGGLFLLEGPTGSGKSTIVDAIVFALYGDVASSDSSKGRIVSTLLPDGVEPFVDLTVDTNHGLLRVRRVPEHERAKKRGTGTTTTKASIKLWRLDDPDDEGVPVSTNIQEANDELSRAIGLTKAQFTQTVVLPQGQFATFLKSRPEERRDVLQDIFGTELYERMAKKLAELAADKTRAVQEAAQAAASRASKFCEVAWYDDARTATEQIPEQVSFDTAADEHDFAVLPGLAEARLDALRKAVAAVKAEEDEARSVLDAATQRLTLTLERNRAIADRDVLRAREQVLVAAAPEVACRSERLALAERAEQVRHALDEVSKSAGSRERCEQTLHDLALQLAAGPDADLVTEVLTAEHYDRAQQDALVAAGELSSLVSDEASLPQRQLQLAEAEQAQRVAAQELARRKAALEVAIEEVDRLEDELQLRRAEADELPAAVTAQSDASRVLAAARQAESLAARLVQLRKAEAAARQAADEADGAYRSARASWLDSLAGVLASELAADEPCPVCGSVAHPVPATVVAGTATKADVDELETGRAEASARLQAATAACNETAGKFEEQAAAAHERTAAQAAEDHAASVALLQSRQAAAERATGIDAELAQRRIRNVAEQAAISSLEQDDVRRGEQVTAQRNSLEALSVRVSDACCGYPTVAERALAIRGRAVSAGGLAAALRALAQARTEELDRSAELAAALVSHGFSSPDEARRALMPGLERDEHRRQIDTHRTDAAVVAAGLRDARFASLRDAQAVDTSELEAERNAADKRLRSCTEWLGQRKQTVSASTKGLQELNKAIARHEDVVNESGPVVRMAELANATGGNQLKITLPTFVLLQRFEEVVDLANVRLAAMTAGRYELRRTDAREGRSQKLGLGLEVIDHSSGDATREPQTLSGGETFKASLAMALGLADAVTAEAGGVELNTLFVDEGFGSLDPESLDSVMEQLTRLRKAGRTVGVISHVADMKQRIAERVSVRSNGDGTSRLTCTTSVDSSSLATAS